jgi:hypothetical protein
MMGLAECANLGLLTDDQHFEFGKTIVEAAQETCNKIFLMQKACLSP